MKVILSDEELCAVPIDKDDKTGLESIARAQAKHLLKVLFSKMKEEGADYSNPYRETTYTITEEDWNNIKDEVAP